MRVLPPSEQSQRSDVLRQLVNWRHSDCRLCQTQTRQLHGDVMTGNPVDSAERTPAGM